MADRPRQDGILLFLVLVLGGIITVTPRMPSVWEQFDPWLFYVFDGGWDVAETFYGVVAAAVLIYMANRLLPFRDWSWRPLLAWLPFAVWSAASLTWSQFPYYSRVEWCFVVLAQPVALVFGAAIGRQLAEHARPLALSALVVLLYLCFHIAVDGEDLGNRGFNVVLTSTWLVCWFPIFVLFMAEAKRSSTRLWTFWLCVAMAFVGIYVPQRMVELAFVICIVALLGGYAKFGCEPDERQHWRASLLALAALHAWLYMTIAATKAASYFPGDTQTQGSWFMVFFKTERYEIFRYWLVHGVENLWRGVGLGWQLPAMTYNHRFIDDMSVAVLAYSHGHNTLLNMWLQLGLFGLAAFLLWIGAIVWIFVRALQSSKVRVRRYALAGLGLVLILFARNMSDDGFREGNVYLGFFLLGALMGMIRAADGETSVAKQIY